MHIKEILALDGIKQSDKCKVLVIWTRKKGGGEPKTNKQTDNFVVTYPFRKLNSGNCHICRFSFIMCLLSLSLKAPLACYLKCQNNLQQACQHPFIGDNSFGGGGGRRI